MLFPYILLFSVVYLFLIGLIFVLLTSHIFVVEFSSGIWWFAVVLYVLLLILCFVFFFHSRFKLLPVRQKVATGGLIMCLTVVSVVLGVTYRPFLNVRVNDKLGALLSPGPFSTFTEFPEARADVFLSKAPPALDQGALGTCWAYAGAGLLSILHDKQQPSVMGCIEKIDVSKWSVSPQAMIDLFPSSNKVAGAPVQMALEIASQTGVPSLGCVPGYSSKWDGTTLSCVCNAPGKQFCLLNTIGAQRHVKCGDGSKTDESFFFVGKSVRRVQAEDMEKLLSSGIPLLAWISFRPSGFPLWTLAEADGRSLRLVSANFIARPQDEEKYQIFTGVAGHALLIIGYGTRDDGVKFWETQNSWGQNWGNKGRLKIERGKNAWGIETFVYTIL